MKNRSLFYLLLFQLAALLLLFPYTPNGEKAMEFLFPAGNYDESSLIPPPTPEPTPEESPEPTPVPIPLTDFYSVLSSELPGRYDLTAVHNAENEFPDELIGHLQRLGIPMALELYTDGTAILGIFDQAILLDYDPDALLISYWGRTLPFFFLDGRLRIQDGSLFMVFEKTDPR